MTLHSVFGILGIITGVLLFLAPVMTFRKIRNAQNTGDFSGIPYVSTLLNCILCTWYGVVSSKHVPVIVLNGVGILLESIYVSLFIKYSSTWQQRKKYLVLVVIILLVSGTTVLVSKLAFPKHQQRKVCGYVAAGSGVLMYGSSLSVVVTVVQTKSAQPLPFFLSLGTLLCACSWLVYGLLGRDPFIYFPNIIGTAFGILQLFVYALYRGKDKTTDSTEATESESVAS